jgi:hypothetical protein
MQATRLLLSNVILEMLNCQINFFHDFRSQIELKIGVSSSIFFHYFVFLNKDFSWNHSCRGRAQVLPPMLAG